MYYPVAVAGTYFLGRNILFRGTSYAIDYLLNANAQPDIKETHTVETIGSMLKTYENLSETHPAAESLKSIKGALSELKDAIDRARLRLSVHEAGYFTRWRTFDAGPDNLVIEKKSKHLMICLDIFTKLIQCPEKPPLLTCDRVQYHKDEQNKNYTYYPDTIEDQEYIMPIASSLAGFI